MLWSPAVDQRLDGLPDFEALSLFVVVVDEAEDAAHGRDGEHVIYGPKVEVAYFILLW